MHVTPGMKRYFQAAGILAISALIGDLWLSAKFGASISWEMTFVMAAISLASGLLLVIAGYFYSIGAKPLGIGLAIVWVPVFMFNIMSNMGVATSNRMIDVQQARWQNAKADEVIKGSAETEAQVKFFLKRRIELRDRLAQLTQTKVGDWSVATAPSSPESLNGAINAKKLEVANESKRGGCGPKCEARTNELAHLSNLQAMAADIQRNEQQLAATKRGLANARAKMDTVTTVQSGTANQSTLYAKLMHWTSSPTAGQIESANEGTGVFTAIILALVASAFTLASAYPHLVEAARLGPMGGFIPAPRPQAPPMSHASTPNPHTQNGDRVYLVDSAAAAALKQKIRDALAPRYGGLAA